MSEGTSKTCCGHCTGFNCACPCHSKSSKTKFEQRFGPDRIIIDEFIEGTEKWLENMAKMQQDKGCVMCGIIPEKMRRLKEAIKNLLND